MTLVWVALTAAQARPLLEQPLSVLVPPAIASGKLGSVAVIVQRGPDRALHTFGRTRDGRRLRRRDRFELGSVSKAFNALLLAEAAGRGELGIDDPVGAHLDWAQAAPIADASLRQLAQHTSGLPRLPASLRDADPADPYRTQDEAALRGATAETPPVETPGATYAYSNLGAALLGAAIASAGDRPWATLLDERIAEPLGLRDLTVDTGELVPGHRAGGAPAPAWTLASYEPAGGVEASLRDLSRLLDHLLRPDSPIAPALATTLAHQVDLGPRGAVALGWHVHADGTVWHNGQTGGHHSLFAFHPERRLGVVVVADTADPIVDAIGFAALQLLAGQNVAPLDLSR